MNERRVHSEAGTDRDVAVAEHPETAIGKEGQSAAGRVPVGPAVVAGAGVVAVAGAGLVALAGTAGLAVAGVAAAGVVTAKVASRSRSRSRGRQPTFPKLDRPGRRALSGKTGVVGGKGSGTRSGGRSGLFSGSRKASGAAGRKGAGLFAAAAKGLRGKGTGRSSSLLGRGTKGSRRGGFAAGLSRKAGAGRRRSAAVGGKGRSSGLFGTAARSGGGKGAFFTAGRRGGRRKSRAGSALWGHKTRRRGRGRVGKVCRVAARRGRRLLTSGSSRLWRAATKTWWWAYNHTATTLAAQAGQDTQKMRQVAGEKTVKKENVPGVAQRKTTLQNTSATFDGGITMSGFSFSVFAEEMKAAASRYSPENMAEFARDLDCLPEAFADIAEALRIIAQRAESEFPVDPRVTEQIAMAVSVQARVGEQLSEAGPSFRRLHEADLGRHEAPRVNEHMWNV